MALPVHGERLAVHSGVEHASATMHVADEFSLNAYRLTGTKMNRFVRRGLQART